MKKIKFYKVEEVLITCKSSLRESDFVFSIRILRSEILTEIFDDKPIKILIGSILLNYGYLKVSYVKEREPEIKRGEQLVYYLTSLIDPRTALEFVLVLYGACAAGLPALRFEIARTVVVGISIRQTLQKFFREFFVKDENLGLFRTREIFSEQRRHARGRGHG